jgi:ABC-2 type transport system ATP-binding protein
VLVSSHVLAEVSQTADDVVVINRGRSVKQGPIGELIAAGGGGGVRVAGPDVRRLGDVLYSQGVQVSGTAERIVVKGRSGEEIGRVIAEHQIVISELTAVESTLEDVYFELTGGSDGGPS